MSEKLVVEYTSSTTFRCKMPETYRGCYCDANGLTFSAQCETRDRAAACFRLPSKASARFRNTSSKYKTASGQTSKDIPEYARTYSDGNIDGDSLNIFYFDKNRSRHLTQGTYKTTFERICDDLNWRYTKTLNKEGPSLIDTIPIWADYHRCILSQTDANCHAPCRHPGASGRMERKEPKTMSNLNLQTVVYREDEHYVAQCLNVDVSSFGDSEAEALANIREALELYFEDASASDASPVEAAEVRTLTLQGA
jgi:predicted RNase H-like HicB family nuclease